MEHAPLILMKLVVHKPKIITAQHGVKQINRSISSERDELVIVVATIYIMGLSLPPAFVFLRKTLKIIHQPHVLVPCPFN